MTRYHKNIIDHRTFNTIGGQLRLIRDLRLVLIKVLGEVHHRLLNQFQVTRTTDNDTHGNWIIGLHLCLVKLGRYGKRSNTTREIGRTLRQRIHLNLYAWCLNLLFHLNITRTTIEESFKRIDIPVLLYHNTFKRDARDLQLARHLRKHHILTPCGSLIRTPIEGLYGETLLLRQIHFLGIETLQVGHITTQACQSYQRIYLICQQDRFLLVHTFLIGTHLDKEIRTGDLATCIPDLTVIIGTLAVGTTGI